MRPRRQHWTAATIDGKTIDHSDQNILALAYAGRRIVLVGDPARCRMRLAYIARQAGLKPKTRTLANGTGIMVLAMTDRPEGPERPRCQLPACPICGKRPIIQDCKVWCQSNTGITRHSIEVEGATIKISARRWRSLCATIAARYAEGGKS